MEIFKEISDVNDQESDKNVGTRDKIIKYIKKKEMHEIFIDPIHLQGHMGCWHVQDDPFYCLECIDFVIQSSFPEVSP